MPRSARTSPHQGRTVSDSDLSTLLTTPSHEDVTNITKRDKRRRLSNDSHDDLTAFRLEMKGLFEKFSSEHSTRMDSLAKLIHDLKVSSTNISEKNLEIDNNIQFVSEQIKSVESKIVLLEEGRKSIISELIFMKDKCEEIERNSLKTMIEIRNVPKSKDDKKENLFNMVHKLSENLKINLVSGDIRDVYRVPSKKDKSLGTLFVELSNTLIKQNILTMARKYNKDNSLQQLNSAHLGIECNTSNSPIFLSERLTARGRRLFFLARDFANNEKFKFCWTANGRVFLRESEGKPHLLVHNEEHLNSLKKSK